MNKDFREDIHRINYLTTEMEALYHQSSRKLGITDSVSIVLYTIYDNGETCLLSDIYKNSGISKQTINSAIRRLEGDGILFLKQYNSKSKKVVLTEKGKVYVKDTAEKLHQAEMNAFHSWPEEEVRMYIQLMEKYANCFRKEIERL